MTGVDTDAADTTRRLLASSNLDPADLGRLGDLASWAASVQGAAPPQPFTDARLIVFTGDHRSDGSLAHTTQNLAAGAAPANVLAETAGVSVSALDISVSTGIPRREQSIAMDDALAPEEVDQAWTAGADLADRMVDEGADILLVGHIGRDASTGAGAVIARITGNDPHEVCGPGSAVDDTSWMKKLEVIRDALWRTIDLPSDPRTTLAALGGADLSAMAGLLTRSAARSTPVVLDDVSVVAAALLAQQQSPDASSWWLASDQSPEPAQQLALARLGLTPTLDLNLQLGQGAGALLVFPILQSAIAVTAEATHDHRNGRDKDLSQ